MIQNLQTENNDKQKNLDTCRYKSSYEIQQPVKHIEHFQKLNQQKEDYHD